jgi:hypothetical protein
MNNLVDHCVMNAMYEMEVVVIHVCVNKMEEEGMDEVQE